MEILLALDSFKGSISSIDVENVIEKTIKKIDDSINVIKVPLADGGEGTLDAIKYSKDCIIENIEVTGANGKKIIVDIAYIDYNTAIIEVAKIVGLSILKDYEKDPYKLTSLGVGEVIKYLLDKNIKKIYIGLGGSSINDAGFGMLYALGLRYYSKDNKELSYMLSDMEILDRIDTRYFDKRIFDKEIILLSDVNNPLCGSNGASYIYGPQKGLKDIEKTDKLIKKFALKLSPEYIEKSGSGSAGGLGFAFLYCNGHMKSGIKEIMEILNIESMIKKADYIITGEGRIDSQSLNGKLPIGVASIAKKYNKKVIAMVGSKELNLDEVYKNGIDLVLDIINKPMSLDFAMENVEILLEDTTKTLLQIISLIGGKNNETISNEV